jgi:glutathione S-transferase
MAKSDAIVLYGERDFESPYVLSAFVALEEKGIPYEMKVLSLEDGENWKSDYRDASLTGRVPSLQHGDFWLSESSAIGEYLEEAFPPPKWPALYPRAPKERARARQIQAWLRSDLMPLRAQRPTSSVFLREPVKPLDADGQKAAERVLRVADALIEDGAFSLFRKFGIVDADLGMMLQRLVANGDPVSAKVRAYAEAVWKRPSVRKFADHARPPR